MTNPLAPHEQYVVDLIAQLERSTMLEQMSDALTEVVQRVQSLQKAGAVTLKIDVKPEGADHLFIAGTLTSKLPVKSATQTAFFVTRDGQLTVDDPMQNQTDLHDIAEFKRDRGDVREVRPDVSRPKPTNIADDD